QRQQEATEEGPSLPTNAEREATMAAEQLAALGGPANAQQRALFEGEFQASGGIGALDTGEGSSEGAWELRLLPDYAQFSRPGLGEDGGIPGEVYCDNSPNVIVCSAAQNCCLLNPGQEYCTPKATPCACTGANCDATTVSCDGPEDCSGGQICCGTFSQQANAYTTLKCQSTCGGQWEREICKPNGTCTTSGQTCSQSSFLTSYIWRCN
ncbi:MAG: hypothetical protein DYH12_25260, partial [Sorangiineae bacterium PRO1]|nr:hypothetical protein [Sorangiineae bacterium PRO1]